MLMRKIVLSFVGAISLASPSRAQINAALNGAVFTLMQGMLVVSANVLVFWLLANSVDAGHISLGEAVVYVQSAVGVSMIAFGGFS